MLRVADCVSHGLQPVKPEATKWQRIRNQIDAAIICTQSNIVSVLFLYHIEIERKIA